METHRVTSATDPLTTRQLTTTQSSQHPKQSTDAFEFNLLKPSLDIIVIKAVLPTIPYPHSAPQNLNRII